MKTLMATVGPTLEAPDREYVLANPEMVAVTRGEFRMGSDVVEAESPIHTVFVDTFLIDATPVTNASFASFVSQTGYVTTAEENERPNWRLGHTRERAQHPVVFVSWFDAVAFASWAGKRLPTEAEWEKAARGGHCQNLFPWGNVSPDDSLVVWSRAKPGQAQRLPGTETVASLPPNDYGLYDVAGQVWEWCQDWFSENTYKQTAAHNPQGPAEGCYRTRRGGAWNVREAFRLRCANRGALPPLMSHANVGFRCARSLDLLR